MCVMQLRPHHILDIVTCFGQGVTFVPHEYGHDLHRVAKVILSDLEHPVEIVIAADEVCRPCLHRTQTGECNDVLDIDPPRSKQLYNDDLDARLCDYLALEPGTSMTIQSFLERVNQRIPGIECVCTHPCEDVAKRLTYLTSGLEALGIRHKACCDG